MANIFVANINTNTHTSKNGFKPFYKGDFAPKFWTLLGTYLNTIHVVNFEALIFGTNVKFPLVPREYNYVKCNHRTKMVMNMVYMVA